MKALLEANVTFGPKLDTLVQHVQRTVQQLRPGDASNPFDILRIFDEHISDSLAGVHLMRQIADQGIEIEWTTYCSLLAPGAHVRIVGQEPYLNIAHLARWQLIVRLPYADSFVHQTVRAAINNAPLGVPVHAAVMAEIIFGEPPVMDMYHILARSRQRLPINVNGVQKTALRARATVSAAPIACSFHTSAVNRLLRLFQGILFLTDVQVAVDSDGSLGEVTAVPCVAVSRTRFRNCNVDIITGLQACRDMLVVTGNDVASIDPLPGLSKNLVSHHKLATIYRGLENALLSWDQNWVDRVYHAVEDGDRSVLLNRFDGPRIVVVPVGSIVDRAGLVIEAPVDIDTRRIVVQRLLQESEPGLIISDRLWPGFATMSASEARNSIGPWPAWVVIDQAHLLTEHTVSKLGRMVRARQTLVISAPTTTRLYSLLLGINACPAFQELSPDTKRRAIVAWTDVAPVALVHKTYSVACKSIAPKLPDGTPVQKRVLVRAMCARTGMVALDPEGAKYIKAIAANAPSVVGGLLALSPMPEGKRLFGNIDDECIICMDEMHQPVALPCGHVFCQGCMLGTIRANKRCCPTCRAALSPRGMCMALDPRRSVSAVPPRPIDPVYDVAAAVWAAADKFLQTYESSVVVVGDGVVVPAAKTLTRVNDFLSETGHSYKHVLMVGVNPLTVGLEKAVAAGCVGDWVRYTVVHWLCGSHGVDRHIAKTAVKYGRVPGLRDMCRALY